MKVCKFCKHGYPLGDKDGLCVYCYLHFNSYPIKKMLTIHVHHLSLMTKMT